MSGLTRIMAGIIGGGAVGALGYGAYEQTTRTGMQKAQDELSRNLTDVFILSKQSHGRGGFLNMLKDKYFNFRLNEGIISTYIVGKNYVKEGVNQAINRCVPIALAVGAIGLGFCKNAGARWGQAICAGILLLGGLKKLLVDVIGFGRPTNFLE